MDVLADLLSRAHARGSVFSSLALKPPWGAAFSGTRPLTLHALLLGDAYLETGAPHPVALSTGDIVLAQSGNPYNIVSTPGAAATPIADLRGEGSAADGTAELLCGAYTLEGTVCDGLLDTLPRFLILRADEQGPALRATIELLSNEVEHESPGQQTVLDHLLDLLLVYALRDWFERPDSDPPGWYDALADPALGRVLRAIHSRPSVHWTVASMATLAGMSRAAFARKFAATVGTPPSTYLTNLRMDLAATALLLPNSTLATVATSIGYTTEFAFSDAFKRHHGTTPGRWRAEHRAAAAGG
ncbi:AraC family transcriptional regulator [Conexibacter woesei]|uniref:AraC family transcriptional regulator n=1 Tax=Conexibacter woesei TaxID=191495 RepID=UPI000419A604|nr:AraC family transcriptional regulator [Conexibacter woesei]